MSARDVCAAYLDAFGTGNPDAVTSLVTHDFINEHTSALGGGCVGKAEYIRRVPGFLASMPGLRYEVEELIAESDRVAAAYTLHARVNDRDIAIRGMMRFRVEGDLIAHRTDYWDSLVFKQQAGIE